MRRITHIIALLALLVALFSYALVTAQSTSPSDQGVSVTYDLGNGGYLISFREGNLQTYIDVCSLGDCERPFPTAWEAMNYWLSLYGQKFGLAIAPLPPPTT